MSLDGMPGSTVETDASDLAVYRQRREAAAALLRTIPPEAFNMDQWSGEQCCALGWLGKLNHDGWRMISAEGFTGLLVAPDGNVGRVGAQNYFGLRSVDADICFAANSAISRLFHQVEEGRITAQHVANTLLQLSYYCPPNDELTEEEPPVTSTLDDLAPRVWPFSISNAFAFVTTAAEPPASFSWIETLKLAMAASSPQPAASSPQPPPRLLALQSQ